MAMDQYLYIPFLGDEHPFTSYFDVHQGDRVLSHPHMTQDTQFRDGSGRFSARDRHLQHAAGLLCALLSWRGGDDFWRFLEWSLSDGWTNMERVFKEVFLSFKSGVWFLN